MKFELKSVFPNNIPEDKIKKRNVHNLTVAHVDVFIHDYEILVRGIRVVKKTVKKPKGGEAPEASYHIYPPSINVYDENQKRVINISAFYIQNEEHRKEFYEFLKKEVAPQLIERLSIAHLKISPNSLQSFRIYATPPKKPSFQRKPFNKGGNKPTWDKKKA